MANLLDALMTVALGLALPAVGSAAGAGALGIRDASGGMLRTDGLEVLTGVEGA